MSSDVSPPRGPTQESNPAKTAGGKRKRPNKPGYIKLKNPADVMAYVQTLVNRIRREGRELTELGKITNLLNTWISAHKDHIETEDLKKLRDEFDAWKAQQQMKQ